MTQAKKAATISDAAVQARTGKSWPEWFSVLDAAGAANMTHQETVAYLRDQHGIGGWWQQMVAVTYEQHTGRRQKYETPRGYQVSATRTIAAPAGALFEAWTNEANRERWLPGAALTIRKATPGKSLRITWSEDQTDLDVQLYARGEARTQVSVQHSRLAEPEVSRMRAYWAAALDRLKQFTVTP